MVNIMSTLAERKPLSIDLDLKTLYRDAFAILEPATISTVLAVWEVYIDSKQPTMYEDNGRSYKLSLNCPYEFRKDVIGVFLDILLKYFGQSQLVFLRKLSHALRCIEIDQFDERVLQWSIALRELEFLGIVAWYPLFHCFCASGKSSTVAVTNSVRPAIDLHTEWRINYLWSQGPNESLPELR